MHELSSPTLGVDATRSSRVLSQGAAAAALALVLAGAAAAQAPPLLVSTSGGVAATSSHAAIDDATLVRVALGSDPFLHFSEGHWQAVLGDVPGDVDGLALRPGFDPAGHRGLVFSLQADEGGFQDGDVLAVAQGGGLEAVVLETDLQAALGVPGSSFDLDALTYDDQGRLLFSLQADLATSTLGPLSDGAVLRLEADGTVALVFTEADVQAAYTAATGSTASVGDVLGLEFQAGEVWASVQSPSSIDGGVLVLGPAARVEVAEADLGLGGAELDGLLVLDPTAALGTIRFSEHLSTPGATVVAEFEGGGPGHPLLVLVAGNAGFASTEGIGTGFGGVFVDLNDPFLSMLPLQTVLLDAGGTYQQSLELPPGIFGGVGFDGEPGWTFQTIDVATLEVSAPYRIVL